MFDTLESFCVEAGIYELVEGVRIGLRPSQTGNEIYVMKVSTNLVFRQQGRGSGAMDELCRIADEHRVELWSGGSGIRSSARCGRSRRHSRLRSPDLVSDAEI